MNLFLRGWRPYAWLALVISVLFGPSLYFDFVCYDDNVLIRDQVEFLRQPANTAQALTRHYFAPVTQGGRYYRPLVTLSYMTDTWVAGGKPWAYHATNVALHLAVTCLVFLLLRLLLAEARPALPFLGALIFAVHPLQAMAVAWIPGRNDMWLTLFMLIGLLAFIRHRETGRMGPLALHLAAFALALLSKESAILLPALCAGWLWLTQVQLKPRQILQALPFYAWVSVLILWLLARAFALGIVMERNPPPGLAPLEQASTVAGLLLRYFGKVLFPLNLALVPDLEESTVRFGVLSLILTALLLWRARPPHNRIMLFGLALGFLALGLSVPFTDRMGARNLGLLEHRMYLPLAGFLLALLAGLNAPRARLAPLLLLAFAANLFGITAERLPALSGMTPFWSRAVRESPHSSDAWHNYGSMLATDNRFAEAEKAFLKALELNPRRRMSHLNLAYIYNKRKHYAQAIDRVRMELENDPGSVKACLAMAQNYAQSGDALRAREWRLHARELE